MPVLDIKVIPKDVFGLLCYLYINLLVPKKPHKNQTQGFSEQAMDYMWVGCSVCHIRPVDKQQV